MSEENMTNNYGEPVYTQENSETEKPVGFWEQFPLSFNPLSYGRMVKTKSGKMVGFICVFLLVCTLISLVKFFIVAPAEINEVFELCPEFSISDGKFYSPEPFAFDSAEVEDATENVYVYLDSDYDSFTTSDVQMIEQYGYDTVLLVSESNLVMLNDGQYRDFKLKDLGGLSIDRDYVVNTLPGVIYIFVVIGYLFYFVGRGLWYFACALVYWFILYIVSKIMKKEFESGELFKASVYGKVPMYTLVVVLGLIPGDLSIPGWIKIIVTCGLLIFAMTKMPGKKSEVSNIQA